MQGDDHEQDDCDRLVNVAERMAKRRASRSKRQSGITPNDVMLHSCIDAFAQPSNGNPTSRAYNVAWVMREMSWSAGDSELGAGGPPCGRRQIARNKTPPRIIVPIDRCQAINPTGAVPRWMSIIRAIALRYDQSDGQPVERWCDTAILRRRV